MLTVLSSVIKDVKCDYIEIRVEDTISTSVKYVGDKLDEAIKTSSIGGAVRVLVNGSWGFVSFNNIDDIKSRVEEAISLAKLNGAGSVKIDLSHKNIIDKCSTPFLKDPTKISIDQKIELMDRYNKILLAGENVISTGARYGDFKRVKYFVNSLGSQIEETTIGTGAFLTATAKDGTNVQQAYSSTGEMLGYEIVEDLDDKAEEIISTVNQLLKAPKVQGGRKTVILDPKLAGVFTHEAFGHLSEADFLYRNEDMKKKMEIGTVFGKEFLNIVDDATINGARGYFKYDDEGVKSQKTELIKNGKLVGRLHSRETSAYMGEVPTGNARAISYRFAPIVRMSSTFIQPQDSSFEEMIADVEDGIYACGMLGGNTDLEMFTFSSEKAFEIKNGKIGKMVRDVILSGNVFETLHNIDMIGDDFQLFGGMGGCGKDGQSPLPVSDGGPHIRIQNLLIG